MSVKDLKQYLDLLNYYHNHQPAKVYPTLADPVTVTAGSAEAWDVGTIAEILPADTETSAFDIHYVSVSDISAVDDYELILYVGASGSEEELGRIRFSRSSNFSQEGQHRTQGQVVPANSRISAAIACGDGDGATVDVSIEYHTYPDGIGNGI
jgi:hypothetical protein